MHRAIALAFCLLLAAGGLARAAGASAVRPQAGARAGAAAGRAHTSLDLRDTEDRLVARNRLSVSLVLGEEAADPASAQSALNKRMRQVLAIAAKVPDVRAETQGYMTIPIRWAKPDGAVTMWRSEETLGLTGTRFRDVLQLTGRLQQEGLAVRAMEYSVTRDRRRAVLKELTSQAFRNLRSKADAAGRDLGLKFLYWSHLAVGEAPRIAPRPLMLQASRLGSQQPAGFPPPVGEAGRATVSVTVSGTAVLGPLP